MQLFGQHDFRFFGTDFWSSTIATTGSRRLQASFGPLLDQATLELGQSREDVEDQFSGSTCGVNRSLVDRTESNTLVSQIFDQCDQVTHGAPQSIQSPNDQDVAGPQHLQTLCQSGSLGFGSRQLVHEDGGLGDALPREGTRSGANNDTGCKHFAIRQEVILEAVLGKLRETLLAGGNMDRLRAALRKELRERATTPKKSNLEALRRRHRDLMIKQVDRGAERLLTAPESLLDVLTEKLSTMKRERDHVGVERQAVEKATEPVDVEAEVERASGKVWTLVEELKDAEPARMRELLGQLVERVELRFSHRQNGKRREFRPTSGRIHFRGESLGFASRGDPRKYSDLLRNGRLHRSRC